MTGPLDLVLARLDQFRLRPMGNDRWRACCPSHGGKNASALSVGVGAQEQVLLKCWHGCSVGEVAQSIGLELEDLFPPRPAAAGSPPIHRRRLLAAGQALALLHEEADLIAVCGANIAHGVALSENDRARCLKAAGRIAYLRAEVMS